MSRVDNVAKNMKFAAASQILLAAANFAVRRTFVLVLGEEYLGLSGLFSDILSMLSLAELGFGTSVVFSLYKPVAQGDVEKIKSLMDLYRRAYQAIGLVVLAAGLALTPALDFFVKEMPDIPHIEWIYILNVLNSSMSYFFVYKASLLFAYQRKYVETAVNTLVKLCSCTVQLALLHWTGNYFLYLGAALCATLAQNMALSFQTDRMYPYLRERGARPLEREDKRALWRNVRAMMFHKFGDVAIFSTDSILTAKFVGVAAVGLYSNYMLVRRVLVTVIDALFSAITSSMGNLNACEGVERKREAFQHVYFFSAWLFGFMSICLLWLYNPFISLWLGSSFLLPFGTVLLIVGNFYMYCMRIPVNAAKNAMGLFWNDRYKPGAEVAVNLMVSVWLARRIGLAGVLLGTLASTAAVPFWVEPAVLYRYGLKQGCGGYFLRYAFYLAVTAAAGALTGRLCALTAEGPAGFVLKMLICVAVPNAAYLLAYGRTRDFGYLVAVARRLAGRFRKGGRA